ncbi:hypothetical protein QJS66_09350 [Kocuria rhizophila]|nr:hypothetical protein QJS66_09350 [Kocuria rhizophila]
METYNGLWEELTATEVFRWRSAARPGQGGAAHDSGSTWRRPPWDSTRPAACTCVRGRRSPARQPQAPAPHGTEHPGEPGRRILTGH